jgi:hypothetical protein
MASSRLYPEHSLIPERVKPQVLKGRTTKQREPGYTTTRSRRSRTAGDRGRTFVDFEASDLRPNAVIGSPPIDLSMRNQDSGNTTDRSRCKTPPPKATKDNIVLNTEEFSYTYDWDN